MEFRQALNDSMTEAGWTREKLAVVLTDSGVSTSSAQVWKWQKGLAEPRRAAYQALRDLLPGFADRVDGKVAAA